VVWPSLARVVAIDPSEAMQKASDSLLQDVKAGVTIERRRHLVDKARKRESFGLKMLNKTTTGGKSARYCCCLVFIGRTAQSGGEGSDGETTLEFGEGWRTDGAGRAWHAHRVQDDQRREESKTCFVFLCVFVLFATDARDVVIRGGATVIAPCPHALTCPMPNTSWCHFKQRIRKVC
jgi:hypothetical protein